MKFILLIKVNMPTLVGILTFTVKPVLSGHSKIDKTKILMTDDSLMKVERMQNAPLRALYNAFDLHLAIIGLENLFFVFFLKVLLY